MDSAPQVGARVKKRWLLSLGLLWILLCGVSARAATYYITVAGLGGEADYEQRFEGLANDLDKLLKQSGGELRVHTLSGKDATRAHITEILGTVAREAKAMPHASAILAIMPKRRDVASLRHTLCVARDDQTGQR